MKPYNVHVQFLGSVAVVTLCQDGAGAPAPENTPPADVDDARAVCRGQLNRALETLPPWTGSVVLDTDRVGVPYPEDALALVQRWALARRIHLVTLSLDETGCPRSGPPRSAVAGVGRGPSGPAGAFRRTLAFRALVQRAYGIRLARRQPPPLEGGA
ncbi:hypothetical protein ABT025_14835 [Streptomyces sp. NPDC002809]|uniref:hypothetical protein n=1 Tax=Streptomyces sp. NPDC002809 TaxID=3154433 RepID=UPI00332B0B5D